MRSTSGTFEVETIIEDVVKSWWADYINTSLSVIDSYNTKIAEDKMSDENIKNTKGLVIII